MPLQLASPKAEAKEETKAYNKSEATAEVSNSQA
jgi:hypothetical protein